MFVVRRTTRQRNRHTGGEAERERDREKMRNQTLMFIACVRKKKHIVGFIDICLPDNNKGGKMVNV